MRAIKLFIKRPHGANGENKSLFTLKLIQRSSLTLSLSLYLSRSICRLTKGAADELICQRRLANGKSFDEPSAHLFNYQYAVTK